MAGIKSCIINGKEYWRAIEDNGDRYYCVATKRRNQHGLTVKRTIVAEGTQRRIDAELAGGMDTLKRFLSEWLEDAEADVGGNVRWVGLCGNFREWADNQGMHPYDSWGLADMLCSLFPKGRSKLYPFGGHNRYTQDTHMQTHHKNEMRLAWVREQLK